MMYRSKIFQTALKGGMLFTATISGLALEAIATNAAPEMTTPGNPGQAVAPLIISGRQSTRPAGTYSGGIAEVIKMLDAKLDSQVVLAYIQNSPIPYNPDATELIALKEHGASTEMLTALLHRGDELRLQLAQAQGAANPTPATPVYDYPPEAAYPESPSPDSGEVLYPPTYYTAAYRWPWLYRTPICINSYRPYWYDAAVGISILVTVVLWGLAVSGMAALLCPRLK